MSDKDLSKRYWLAMWKTRDSLGFLNDIEMTSDEVSDCKILALSNDNDKNWVIFDSVDKVTVSEDVDFPDEFRRAELYIDYIFEKELKIIKDYYQVTYNLKAELDQKFDKFIRSIHEEFMDMKSAVRILQKAHEENTAHLAR
jgi:hypothetical protein